MMLTKKFLSSFLYNVKHIFVCFHKMRKKKLPKVVFIYLFILTFYYIIAEEYKVENFLSIENTNLKSSPWAKKVKYII